MTSDNHGGHCSVLIVEDSPTQALQLRALLEEHELTAQSVPNGESALELLNGDLPDLVIVDYHLPGMNGDELARQIRQNLRTRFLPLLMLTKAAEPGAERQGLESGADAYLPKSSDPELLILRIQSLLRQQAGRAQDLRQFAPFRRGRLLVIDRKDLVTRRLSRLLTEEAYTLSKAATLAEARAQIAAGGADCVLIDLDQGGREALALCKALDELRGPEAGARFQILALLAQPDDGDWVQRAFAAGADDILPRDLDDEGFKLRVRVLMRRKLANDESLEAASAEAARMKQLLEGERRFRTIFDTGFQLIWLLTLDGRVIVANRTVGEVTGAPGDSSAVTPLWQAAWWAGAADVAAALEAGFHQAVTGEPARFEATLKDQAGHARMFDVLLRPALDEAGTVVQVVVEAHDVTAFKETEAALRQSQKMEVIGQITGGVAHDFNNLLMAVLANLDLLHRRLADREPQLERYIEGAIQGAKRGAALTQRLLAFARKQDLRSEAVDIATLLTSMRELLDRSVGPTITVAYKVADKLRPARADHNQLELAILNLVVNARDAMPNGGRITLGAAETIVEKGTEALSAGPYIRIRVIDQGTGMDADTIQRAIEPFFSTKEAGKGTGLGLSMVHGLAVQSGGALNLESEVGHGTTIELLLPIADGEEAASEAPAETIAALVNPSRVRILVLDDDPLILMSTVDMLQDLGHETVSAGTVEQAQAILKSDQTIDMLLSDFAMPRMTGAEFAVVARRQRPGLPVLLATGYADLPSGTELGLPRLSKPYNFDQLSQAVAQVLASGKE